LVHPPDDQSKSGDLIEKRVVHCSDLSGVALFLFFLETLPSMESAVLEFWRDYLDSLPPDLDQEPKPSGVFSFGIQKSWPMSWPHS
jgi:hypothetical protein